MPIRISADDATAMAAAGVAGIDGGSGAGKLRIYTGAQPAGPGSTTAETLLAEFTLSDPAFAATDPGEQDLDITPALTDAGIADGTAGWCRFVDSDAGAGAAGRIDGKCGVSGDPDADLILGTVTISTGVTVEVIGFTLTQPTS